MGLSGEGRALAGEGRVQVPVYYDFASTICFVAHRALERLAPDLDGIGVALEWRPLDLVAITGWPRGAVVAGPARANALRVAAELGVEARMPARWTDSRGAHGIALALRGTPHEPAWRERVWTALFEQGRDPGDAQVLASLARDLGLDAARLLAGSAEEALAGETERARRAGVTGVPTFMLDGWPFGGIQADDTMRSVLRRWVERRERGRR